MPKRKHNGPKGEPGRPSKLNDDIVQKLTEIFRIDGSVEEACSRAGIARSDYYYRCKEVPGFLDKMQKAQEFPKIFAKQVLFKSMRTDNDSVNQRGAIEFLRRRDRRYSDKVEQQVDMSAEVNAEVKEEVKYEDKSVLELEKIRKDLLGF